MYKDLAKYWIGFVPVASLLGLGVALGPSAAQLGQAGVGVWLAERWPVLVAVVLALAALVAMTLTCARVLAAEPTAIATLLDDTNWLSDAFSRHAVGRPYFRDAGQFAEAELACRTPGPDGTFDPRAAAVGEVTQKISALSAELNAKARFAGFTKVFAAGVVVVIAAALGVVGFSSRDLQAITEPTPVTLYLPAAAGPAVRSATGCQRPAEAAAVAVGGTWDRPRLRLFGPGCGAGAWTPTPDLQVLVTKS